LFKLRGSVLHIRLLRKSFAMDSEDDSDIFITPSTFRSPQGQDPNFNIESFFGHELSEPNSFNAPPNEVPAESSTESRFTEPLSHENGKD
ncbi:hypothetical protein AC249_AIPGENE7885, partial [Exaiptasia diaphana]